MEVNFKQEANICRVCLASERPMSIVNRIEAEFKDLAGIIISPSDGLPQSLCYVCSALLKKCVRFRSNIIRSHNLLSQYMYESIPFASDEISPSLSWTNIVCDEIPSAEAEKLAEQINYAPVDIGIPVIANIESAQVNQESTAQECWYDRPHIDLTGTSSFALDAHKIGAVTSSEERTEELEFEKQTNFGEDEEKINSIVDNAGASDITETESFYVKGEEYWNDEDNITIEECGVSIRERAGIATQGKVAVDTSPSEIIKSELVSVKHEQFKSSYDVPGRDELLDTCKILTHCDQSDDRSNAISPNRDVRDEHIKHSIDSGSHDNVESYKCDTCNKWFNNKKLYNYHLRRHIDDKDKPYRCDICMKGFINYNSIGRHIRKHYDYKGYVCNICQKRFSQKSHYTDHYRTHTGERPYKCEICMKSFHKKNNLTNHYQYHSNDRPSKCDVCMKSFKTYYQLKRHKLTHLSDRPYKCELCTKGFLSQSKLKYHSKIHSNVKSYKCEICSKCFTRNDYLTRHYQTHAGNKPYTCYICMRSFTVKSSLVTHIRRHTNNKR